MTSLLSQTHKYTHNWKQKKEKMWETANIIISFLYLLTY